MKTPLLIFGTFTAFAIILIAAATIRKSNIPENAASPEFKWTQVAPPGSGTHQYEWKPGTWPKAIVPVTAFNNNLWMIGQKMAWASTDGIHWDMYKKTDWGEKISMAYVFFNNTFWVSGGMEYSTNTFLNDIWASTDGKNWTQVTQHAEWTQRKGHTVVEFNKKLWLFGGSIGVDKDRSPNKFINDVWTSEDGIHWTKILGEAPWPAREAPGVVVFKNQLWMLGGQGYADIWRSANGKDWIQVTEEAPWKHRYDHGALVYDNLLFVFGGRDEPKTKAYNDVWFSIDGKEWRIQTEHAPWSERSGVHSSVFKNKMWIYSGKATGKETNWSGDIWVMERVVK